MEPRSTRDESPDSEGARQEVKLLPLPNMVARAASAQPLPMDRPGSISNRQLSRARRRQPMRKGSVEPPSGTWTNENAAYGWARGLPANGKLRFVSQPPRRCTAPGAVHSRGGGGGGSGDVGYARAGGSAGPERAA